MDWRSIICAVSGEPTALKRLADCGMHPWLDDPSLFAALLLLEEVPHPAAALVVAGIAARERHVRPVAAALAPPAARALAEWCADPDWAKRRIGSKYPDDLIYGVAHLIASLRTTPDALRDAAAVVVRNGDADDVAACLAALGGDGWGLLADEERRALWTRALQDRPAAIGYVWPSLTDAQREDAAQRAAAEDWTSAALIGGNGAAAWTTTYAALRDLLIDTAAQEPSFIQYCPPPRPA